MRPSLVLPALCTLLGCMPALGSTELYEGLLSKDATRSATFLEQHPEWDGRGVVIAVLDTGVDVGAPGLTNLPSGERKVIVARDFSGQGTIPLEKVTPEASDEAIELRTDDGVVLLPNERFNSTCSYRLGWIRETQFHNAGVRDLNGDGDTADVFALTRVTCPGEPEYAIVDRDTNSRLDEAAIGSFERTLKGFQLGSPDPKKDLQPLNYTLHLDEDPNRAELHFDDGGHGTHVAGIAAGYQLFGKTGFNGIAPGAQIMSLKIGNNALAGGATTTGSKKKAIQFASRWATENKRPVVLNLSYGIGSEREGFSDIDTLVTEELQKNPNLLYMSTSAGNSGPSISTVGQPAAATLAFTAGAALPRENAQVLFNSKMNRDRIFSFSSRGGELTKPDAVLPGTASSSVPPFLGYHVMSGTSMAAPQGAGVHAILLSAARASGIEVNNGMVRRAMTYSAEPLKDYTLLDQGYGMVNTPAAWALLQKLVRSSEAQKVLGYSVETSCVTCPYGSAPASYWRVGNHIPSASNPIDFSIRPLFSEQNTAQQKNQFYEVYELRSETSWLDVRTPNLAFRGDQAIHAKVEVEGSKLKGKPGVHVGTVLGRSKEGPNGLAGTAFELRVVVVVPETFSFPSESTREWKSSGIDLGEVHRHFIVPPVGATSGEFVLKATNGTQGNIRLVVADPEGRSLPIPGSYTSKANEDTVRFLLTGDTFKHGVWELDVYNTFRSKGRVPYTLEAHWYGIETPDFSLLHMEQGQKPTLEGEVVNHTGRTFEGKATGILTGYGKEEFYDIEGDELSLPFTVTEAHQYVEFVVRVDPDTYALFTDVAISIVGSDGKVASKSGLGQASERIRFRPPSPGDYTLEIRGALTHESPSSWSVEVDESHGIGPIPLRALSSGGPLVLYPSVPKNLIIEAEKEPAMLPDGYEHRGFLKFEEKTGKRIWLHLPLRASN